MQPKGKDKYLVTRMQEQAEEAKQLMRTWDRQRREIKRKEQFDAREAEKKAKQLARMRKTLKDFATEVESGEVASKEVKAVKAALKELAECYGNWVKDGDPVAGTEAVTLAVALVAIQLLKMGKKVIRAAKQLGEGGDDDDDE